MKKQKTKTTEKKKTKNNKIIIPVSLLIDYTRIKILIASYVMRSRVHARLRGLIAWWESDTKLEKEDEQLKIASGTVLSNGRVRSRLIGKTKLDAKKVFPT